MYKLTFFAILHLAFLFQASAQEKLSAKDILDKTSIAINNSNGFNAKFTTTSFDGTTPINSFDGTLDVKGEKYIMKTDAISVWFNGQEQWTLMPGNNEVSLVTPTPEEMQVSSPMSFATIYKQGFKLSKESGTLRNRKVWNITLLPKDRKQEPSKITVTIDQQTYLPLCLRVRNNGDWTRISITDIDTNTNFSDSHFTFPTSDYPEYKIIDLR